MNAATAEERAAGLALWRGPVDPQPLGGGITNVNFVVEDAGERFVVRVGDDIPLHHVMRFNERSASLAAYHAGVSPQVVHTELGILVMRFIDGHTCSADDIRDPDRLARVMFLIRRAHTEMPHHLRGPLLAFWVFHVIRDYAHTLMDDRSRYVPRLPDLLERAASLERAVGPVDVVFGHNDLLPGNFIDDGNRVWLIDWDYAGFNSPLFDLANLASNNAFDADQEAWMLQAYYGRFPDGQLLRSYRAMKSASLLREAMWSMVSEIHSRLSFDYAAYTREYLDRYAAAQVAFDLDRGQQ
jgi:thiamine kinase-like enzyme